MRPCPASSTAAVRRCWPARLLVYSLSQPGQPSPAVRSLQHSSTPSASVSAAEKRRSDLTISSMARKPIIDLFWMNHQGDDTTVIIPLCCSYSADIISEYFFVYHLLLHLLWFYNLLD